MYQCDTGSTGQCNNNPIKHVQPLTCEDFHKDSSGPWYMISKAMSGSRCGEEVVSLIINKVHYYGK